jgi:hypothetical protein
VIAASHDAVATGDVTTLAAQTSQLRTAREAMSNALANTDLLLNMLRSVTNRPGRHLTTDAATTRGPFLACSGPTPTGRKGGHGWYAPPRAVLGGRPSKPEKGNGRRQGLDYCR